MKKRKVQSDSLARRWRTGRTKGKGSEMAKMFNTDGIVKSFPVLKSFRIPTGEICELLPFCYPGDFWVDGKTMISRGEVAQASMTEADFQKFWKYRYLVPYIPYEVLDWSMDRFYQRSIDRCHGDLWKGGESDYYVVFPKATVFGCARYVVSSRGMLETPRRLYLPREWTDAGMLVRFR